MSRNEIPEIRFSGFIDNWKKIKLEECVERIATGLNPRDNFKLNTGGLNYYVTIKNFVHGHLYLDDKCDKVDDNALKIIQERSDLQKDDILFTSIGRVGDCYLIESMPSNWNINESVFSLRPNQTVVVPEYLFQTIHSNGVLRQILSNITGSTFKSIKIGDLKNAIIPVPEKKEQQRIGEFITTIDNLIDLHQHKYDVLVNIKKSMMERLFPQKDRDIPEIRFSGFNGPWKQCSLEGVFDFLQNNTLSRAELSDEQGVAKNIHYGDVLIKFGEYLDVTRESLPFIESQSITDKYTDSFLKDGDIIMADTAEDETVGKCTEVEHLYNIPIISGLHTIPMRPRIKFAEGYLGYYMNSNAYHDQLLPLMQGTKVMSVSKTAIQNTIVKYPIDAKEQEVIGKFLLHLDKLITLYSQKIERMKNIKSSIIGKIYV